MNWRDIGRQVASAAPVLGAALGGPVGGAAGALIASVFGVENTPDAVEKAIKADPESAIKLRELEQRHIEHLTELENDRFRIETADVQSARGAHSGSWMPWVLTCILAAMVAAIVASLVFVAIPESNREVVYLVVGQLIGGFSTAIAYWLGSSQSSKSKDAQLQLTRKQH